MARRTGRKTIDDYIREGKPEKLIAVGSFYAILLVFLLLLMTVIMNMMVSGRNEYEKFMETAVKTEAKCTNVWNKTESYTVHTRHGTRRRHRTVYYANVEYEYKGTKYQLTNVKVSSSTRIGSYITIYISPDNPLSYRKYVSNHQYRFSLFMVLAPSLFAIGAMLFTCIKAFKSVRTAKENKEMMRYNTFLQRDNVSEVIARNDPDYQMGNGGYNLNGNYQDNYYQNGSYQGNYSYNQNGSYQDSYNQNGNYQDGYNQNGSYQNSYDPYGNQTGYNSNGYYNSSYSSGDYNGYDTAGSGQKKDIDDFKSFDSAPIGGDDNEW